MRSRGRHKITSNEVVESNIKNLKTKEEALVCNKWRKNQELLRDR